MNTYQQNQVTMFQAVLRFLGQDGAPLAGIKRIADGREALAALVTRIGKAAENQDRDTTEVTGDRQTSKTQAAARAEVLRLLVVALSSDAAQRGELKTPLSKKLVGKDADLLAYLQKVDAAVGTVPAAALADAGYSPQVRTDLQADIAALTATQGAARQLATGASTATQTLPSLIAGATLVLEEELDPFVGAQRLAQPALVAQYEALRRIVRTGGRRAAQYRGVTRHGQPALVFDRREAGVAAPTLGNRSGRGLALRYYTAATPAALPAPGQGVLVQHKTDQRLPDYGLLGPTDAPFLLVVQEQPDGEGRWVVR